ncbi:MAG: hypothetical protein KJ871_00295 [Alphaproteobacteria bacterium]|nr:hypothetical protein [Alphaproteobacteria bacterium]MBU2083769.1 hypothetical protein [Alphaproteobacteria bacterium]MBU2142554.1 hypothetical protein [Alphaproteobacteria bacterium]MBU2197692.1 hypothetical protein [Alphaproteobacteria bacterium]
MLSMKTRWKYCGSVALCFTLASCSYPVEASPSADTERTDEADPTSWQITEIYWSDADSGRINGERFRLSDIDAPETGGVGAAVGPAQCEKERERGFAAKEFVVELTRDKELKITKSYGFDKMPEPRLLIDLSADGVDVSQRGVEAGYLRPWPHDGTKALAPKPDWCD